MPEDTPFMPISTAVINFTDQYNHGQTQLRVYTCDGYNIIERYYEDGIWRTSNFKKPGSQVSATSWSTDDGPHIRVYCTSDDITTEYCSDPGNPEWTTGQYTTI